MLRVVFFITGWFTLLIQAGGISLVDYQKRH